MKDNRELRIINEQEVLGKEFKVYGTFKEPLFLAKDVANWIEHSDRAKMLQSVDEDEKVKNIIPTLGGNQEMWFLTEDGLYEVLMLSRKPIAKEFKKQVKEILKGLRKGEITLVPQLTEKDTLRLMLFDDDKFKVIEAHKQLIELETRPLIDKIEEDKPLVEFSNSIAQSADSIDIGTFAKLIKDEGIKLGRNKLFQWLRENKYLMNNNNNLPYQKYIDNGYFEIIEYNVKTSYGDKLVTKTLIKGKGQIKLMEKIRKEFANKQ